MILPSHKTSARIVRYRTTVIPSSHARPSYDRRATLIYKTILASHHAIIVKSYVIVRLSYDCRWTVVRFTFDSASHQAIIVKSYVIVRLSYDYGLTVVRCRTIYLRFHSHYTDASQPIVSNVTTKIRLQYGPPPPPNIVAESGKILEIYNVTHRTTSQLGVTKA